MRLNRYATAGTARGDRVTQVTIEVARGRGGLVVRTTFKRGAIIAAEIEVATTNGNAEVDLGKAEKVLTERGWVKQRSIKRGERHLTCGAAEATTAPEAS